jgi:hypothetical protein
MGGIEGVDRVVGDVGRGPSVGTRKFLDLTLSIRVDSYVSRVRRHGIIASISTPWLFGSSSITQRVANREASLTSAWNAQRGRQ